MNNLLVMSQNKDLVSNDRKGQREKIHDLNHVSELYICRPIKLYRYSSKLELITKQIKFYKQKQNNLIEEVES